MSLCTIFLLYLGSSDSLVSFVSCLLQKMVAKLESLPIVHQHYNNIVKFNTIIYNTVTVGILVVKLKSK